MAEDVGGPRFRGCAFNNASIEFEDPEHPARVVAREHRRELLSRLPALAERMQPGGGEQMGARRAPLIDGMYVSAAHLGRPRRGRSAPRR